GWLRAPEGPGGGGPDWRALAFVGGISVAAVAVAAAVCTWDGRLPGDLRCGGDHALCRARRGPRRALQVPPGTARRRGGGSVRLLSAAAARSHGSPRPRAVLRKDKQRRLHAWTRPHVPKPFVHCFDPHQSAPRRAPRRCRGPTRHAAPAWGRAASEAR
ncbi:MAG: hypothetical protein J3K34DRAFT_515805, partial [Monoraphidium minutum]